MGNWSSCCLPDKQEEERTHILNNPADPGSVDEIYPRGGGGGQEPKDNNGAAYGTIANGAQQEQNAWGRTLAKMTMNVIDVSSTDMASIEQSECAERQKIYNQKLNQMKNPLLLKYRQNQSQQKNGEAHLMKTDVKPISSADVDLIMEYSDKSYNAIKSGFVINVDEELIVQFNP